MLTNIFTKISKSGAQVSLTNTSKNLKLNTISSTALSNNRSLFKNGRFYFSSDPNKKDPEFNVDNLFENPNERKYKEKATGPGSTKNNFVYKDP
jgi:hypothetical protein